MNRYIVLLEEIGIEITEDHRKYMNDCINEYVLILDYIVWECTQNGDYNYNESGCACTKSYK